MSKGNLYQRGPQKIWWFRARINGVEYRESLRTADAKLAKRARDKRISELKSRIFHNNVGWREAILEWGAHITDQVAPATLRRYAVSLSACEPFLLPVGSVTEIDGKLITDIINARRRAGASAATVRRDLTAISSVLDFCEAQGWREGNPTLSKRRMLRERRDPITLPEDSDIEAIIASASMRFGWLIRAALLTGCRQSELTSSTWRGFNAQAGTLTVTGKGNKRRVLRLSPDALELFQSIPVTMGRGGPSPLIFCNEDGSAFSQAASDFTHVRRAALAKAENRGVLRFRFHDLRHAFAVRALRAGMSIYALSQYLGHTSVKTTEIYLAHVTSEEAAIARDEGVQDVPGHKSGHKSGHKIVRKTGSQA